ncbi:hypothetical protein [Legionella longbeachae]|uniref:Uncharacterized protein n=1 Tax=Legionella longbeachae serogroup 1 (strain NSW150) TaxID=661367 RepID=D3HQ58_LEGLN|nr:hypothetical protein [Legionella longbeachae]VEE01543.1 Uncharacterised protein [Legionella oakridgensis]HBD7396305.1 hypothetical protein [Legionella pneumophila]ARB92106.1 hypothetical protein A6J40_07910 [Legionella longbeachae]ARM34713.1 hypothetical protein B0B39_14810 [Legionella longbeachae]EEZ95869.1 hypothetical protein LLB_1050 [Legionella longbeachae D-4968]
MLVIKKISQTGERIVDSLEAYEIAQLYNLYLDTYKPIGGSLLTLEEFQRSIDPQDTHFKYNRILILEDQNEIGHCFLLRTTPFGTRISFGFGQNDSTGRERRLNFLKKMLHEDHYTEASGAVAKQLLKDDTVKLLMTTESNYYACIKTNHGKKLVFGSYKNAIEIHPKTKSFIFYLYAYIALKYSLGNKHDTDNLAMFLHKLRELYTIVHYEKNIPQIYKLILLSKLARKIHFLDPTEGNNQLNELNDLLFDAKTCPDAQDELLLFSNKLSTEEQQLVDSIFYEKRKQLENKTDMTFFKNYLSLAANESLPASLTPLSMI